MSKIIDDMLREAEEKAAEKATKIATKLATERATEKTRIEDIQTVMRKLKYTAQQAMDLIGIPESEQPKYLAKL